MLSNVLIMTHTPEVRCHLLFDNAVISQHNWMQEMVNALRRQQDDRLQGKYGDTCLRNYVQLRVATKMASQIVIGPYGQKRK